MSKVGFATICGLIIGYLIYGVIGAILLSFGLSYFAHTYVE